MNSFTFLLGALLKPKKVPNLIELKALTTHYNINSNKVCKALSIPNITLASCHFASFLVGTKHTVQYLIGMPGKTFSRLLLITAAK